MKLSATSANTGAPPKHVVGDPGQPGDVGGDGAPRIDEWLPLREDLVIAKFNSANLGDTVSVRPAAGCFDVDDNIILLRIEPEIDAGDLGLYTGVTKLAQARELVAANLPPLPR
jgi:hypothetical protein